MALKFDYIKYLISKLNKVEYAKYYDYICNFKNGKYKIYRREYEGKPWVLYMTIPVDENGEIHNHVWTVTEEARDPKYKINTKHMNYFYTREERDNGR